jgi:hypothetical protein
MENRKRIPHMLPEHESARLWAIAEWFFRPCAGYKEGRLREVCKLGGEGSEAISAAGSELPKLHFIGPMGLCKKTLGQGRTTSVTSPTERSVSSGIRCALSALSYCGHWVKKRVAANHETITW